MPPTGEVNSPLQHQTAPLPGSALAAESDTCRRGIASLITWYLSLPLVHIPALSPLGERVDRRPDALHREAGRAFARRPVARRRLWAAGRRVIGAQGPQPATARRRVRGWWVCARPFAVQITALKVIKRFASGFCFSGSQQRARSCGKKLLSHLQVGRSQRSVAICATAASRVVPPSRYGRQSLSQTSR